MVCWDFQVLVIFCNTCFGLASGITELWTMGYAAVDIVSTIFRVTKQFEMSESTKLEFIKVSRLLLHLCLFPTASVLDRRSDSRT